MARPRNNKGSLSRIPSERPPESSQQVTVHASQYTYSGPIPPVEHVRDWEELCPGSADRFLQLMEKQVDHRLSLEKTVVTSNVKKESQGQHYAFILFMTLLLIGGILTFYGMSIVGIASLITAIIVPLALFFHQKSEGKKELRAKKENIAPEEVSSKKQIEKGSERKQINE